MAHTKMKMELLESSGKDKFFRTQQGVVKVLPVGQGLVSNAPPALWRAQPWSLTSPSFKRGKVLLDQQVATGEHGKGYW